MRSLLGGAAVVVAVLLGSSWLGAEEIGCPARVEVRQSAAAVPAGWTAGVSELPTILAGVTFYSGPPEERASLVPDANGRRGGMLTSTWRFGRGTKEVFWVSCGYLATSVVLSRALPVGTTECTVEYDPGAKVGGQAVVKRIRCR